MGIRRGPDEAEASTCGLHYTFLIEIGPNEKYFKVWRRRGPAQLRRLRGNVQTFKKAFENLKVHAASINASENVFLVQYLDDEFQLTHRLAEIATGLAPADLRHVGRVLRKHKIGR